MLLLDSKKTLKYCSLAPLLSGSGEVSVDLSSYSLEAEYPLVKVESISEDGKETSWNINVDGWQSPGSLSSVLFESKIVNYGSSVDPAATAGKLLVRKDANSLIYHGIKHINETLADNKSIEAADAGDGYADCYNMLQLKGF